jgi:hypothetical protein
MPSSWQDPGEPHRKVNPPGLTRRACLLFAPLRRRRGGHPATAADHPAGGADHPAGDPLSLISPPADEPARWVMGLSGQMCGLFAVDIAGFTDERRDERVQLYLRESMYRMLEKAFDGSSMRWGSLGVEDRGDGALAVLPPTIPVRGLADPLPERIRGLIRQHNEMSSARAQLQLRAAAHVGTVYHDRYGYSGDAVNQLFRLLNAPKLKRMLASSTAELAFISSGYLYESVIRRHPTLVDPAAFQPILVNMTPSVTARGWVHMPETEAATSRILPFGRPALPLPASGFPAGAPGWADQPAPAGRGPPAGQHRRRRGRTGQTCHMRQARCLT